MKAAASTIPLARNHPPAICHPMAWPFLLMLVISLITPSGNLHGALQPKPIALAIAVLFTALYAITRKQLTKLQVIVTLTCLGLTMLVAFSFLLGSTSINNSLAEGTDETAVFVITILAAGMTIFWYLDGGITYPVILKTILGANLVYNVLKIGFILAVLAGWLTFESFLDLGYSVQTTTIKGSLFRFQSGSDVPTPFLLLFALMGARLKAPLGRTFRSTYIVIAIISIFFSYSRLQWVVGILAYPMWLLSDGSWKRILIHSIACVTLMLAALAVVGVEKPLEIVSHRFFSGEVENSDFTRQVQTEGLITQFLQDPYLGNGIGGTPVDSVLGRYSYHFEVQWLAFLMQFGIVGITGILLPLIALGMAFLQRPLTSAKLSFLGMYLLWLFAGFTNPFLISLTSGIVYGLFFITALRLRLYATF